MTQSVGDGGTKSEIHTHDVLKWKGNERVWKIGDQQLCMHRVFIKYFPYLLPLLTPPLHNPSPAAVGSFTSAEGHAPTTDTLFYCAHGGKKTHGVVNARVANSNSFSVWFPRSQRNGKFWKTIWTVFALLSIRTYVRMYVLCMYTSI